MRVKVIEIGYHNLTRWNPGDVFELDNPEHFSDRWMQKTEDNVTVREFAKKAMAPEASGKAITEEITK